MKNEYNSLSDFVKEYSGIISDEYETYIGIDFNFKNKSYRMCLEPIGKYYLYEVSDTYKDGMPEFKVLGIFDSIEELLNSKTIQNICFKDIILSDETIITGKD